MIGEAQVASAAPGIELQGPVPEEVEVEDRRLSSNSTTAELKLVCKALGIGSSGSKTVLYKRNAKHVRPIPILVSSLRVYPSEKRWSSRRW